MSLKEFSLSNILEVQPFNAPIQWESVFDKAAPLYVEIGFGYGEVLLRDAQANPGTNYVGIEQHWERIYKTLRHLSLIRSNPEGKFFSFRNVRIVKVDARIAFERYFYTGSIDQIMCLFPCPWPKKGHIKHRLFSRDFLRMLNNRLKKNGCVQVVTDFEPYGDWILSQIQRTGFACQTKRIPPRFRTKFEKKWQEEGHADFFEINLTKKRHIHVPVKEGVPLKAYRLRNFDPEKISFLDQTGPVSVIYKELFYDAKRQWAMVHLVVSEDYLTQHFWVTIKKVKDFWRICKADGQTFFPTPGVARAIEFVYEMAKKST
ncbi:MAG: hypothetical protein K8S27_06600 [Candidatus Omnitrophica bacterium]|nr:hypothetical protein [Candidatus Omnitrophota bacterium]